MVENSFLQQHLPHAHGLQTRADAGALLHLPVNQFCPHTALPGRHTRTRFILPGPPNVTFTTNVNISSSFIPLINLLWCNLTMFCSFKMVLHLTKYHTCCQLTGRSWGDISCLWSCEEPLLGWHSGESSQHVGCPQKGPVHINNDKSIPASGAPAVCTGMTRHTKGEEEHYLWNAFKMGFGWTFNVRLLQNNAKTKEEVKKKRKVNWRFRDFKEIRWNNKRNNPIRRLPMLHYAHMWHIFCRTVWMWVSPLAADLHENNPFASESSWLHVCRL